MDKLLQEQAEFLTKFDVLIKEAQSKAIFVRDIELQRKQVEILNDLISEISALKEEASINKQNDESNFLMCIQFSTMAVRNELLTIINLKDNKPTIAWNQLVTAQELIKHVINNHPLGGDYLIGYAQRLYLYEKTLFPDMYFASRGCTVSDIKCSICHHLIEECEHIVGKAYMGNICEEIIENMVFEEISIVKDPADKRCIITSFSKNNKRFDTFTHKEIID